MQKFDTPAPITAVLDIPAGRIQFIAADRADTTVEVRPANPAKSRDVQGRRADHRRLRRRRPADPQPPSPTTSSSAPPDPSRSPSSCPPAPASRPRPPPAELRGVGRLGDVAFEGAYRQIKIDEAASVRLTAIDGDVEIGRLGGPAEISTARGDIRITEAARGTVVLSTQSGDISVAAAAGVSAALDAGTCYGRISNALKNNGSAELDIRATTSHGDITARSL